MTQPTFLVLDDYEGHLATAPAMTTLQSLADVTILAQPLTPADQPLLAKAQILLALRERTRLDEAFFANCPQLELVLQTGGHAYHLEKEAASQRGILVALGRGATRPTIVVPELAFGLMLGLTRQLYPLTAQMAQGHWPPAIGGSLHGRKLGILGYGRHGRPIARIARAFGMKILAWDRGGSHTDDETDVVRLPLDDLLATADIVSIHLRLSNESQGLLNRERLAKMQPHALLINTARGAIIDEEALIEALQEKRIAGAGLDVFAVEPLAATSPLRTLPNVLLTPHIGWQVSDVFHEFVAIAANQFITWRNGQLPRQQVLNPEAATVPRTRTGNIA